MPIESNRELVLSKLSTEEIPSLTETIGRTMEEACAVCLEDQKHQKGVSLRVELKQNDTSIYTFKINEWKNVDDKMKRAWGDLGVATEQAAYGIAILLIEELTEFTVVRRAPKGGGFDFWLDKKQTPLEKQENQELIFNDKGRLEVSGILNNTEDITRRINKKKKQVQVSDNKDLPAFIVVVEFSSPVANVVKK